MQAKYRLKKNRTFVYTYKKGISVACRDLVLVYAGTSAGKIQAGFSISKKIGKSVVRNKIKRRLKEAFRAEIPKMKTGYNFVFVARKPAAECGFAELKGSLCYLLKKAGLYK